MTPILVAKGCNLTFKPIYRNAYTFGEKFPQIPLKQIVTESSSVVIIARWFVP
jgi:hypothetical protein